MFEYKISLLHATYQSKGHSRRVRDAWLTRAAQPELIEHCLGFESTDNQVREEFEIHFGFSDGKTPDGLTKFKTTEPHNTPSAVRNWNVAAEISTGGILLAVADDLIPEQGWDLKVRTLVGYDLSSQRIWCLRDRRCTNNSFYEDDLLPRHPLMTRSLYEAVGFFFDPRFVSVGPDNEWLIRGISSGALRDGRVVKLHHTEGHILNKSGEVVCGCSRNRSSQPQNNSQIRMHDKRWVMLAQSQYNNWSKAWRLIGWIGTMEEWSSQLMSIYSRFNFKCRNPHVLIFFTMCFSKMSLQSRILLTKSLVITLKNLPPTLRT